MATSPSPVLVIEDDNELAELYRFLLAEEGHSAELLPDGRAALERLAHPPTPALILLDLLLPFVDGRRVLQRAMETLNPPPVVIVVSALGSEARQHCMALGARDYLTKPFDIDDLRQSFRAHLPDTP